MRRIAIALIALALILGATPSVALACLPEDPGFPTLC